MKRTTEQVFSGLKAAGISDITYSIPLGIISLVTTGGDEDWGPRQGARGAWAVHEPTNGNVPESFENQAKQAKGILEMMRRDFLAGLSIKTNTQAPDTTLQRAAASWDFPWGSLATKPVGGAKDYLREFLCVVVLGWRYPAQTQAALDALAGTDYNFADVIRTARLPEEAWIYGAVEGVLTKDRAYFFPSDANQVKALEDPSSPWGFFKSIKTVAIVGAVLLGLYLVFKTIGAGKQAGVIGG